MLRELDPVEHVVDWFPNHGRLRSERIREIDPCVPASWYKWLNEKPDGIRLAVTKDRKGSYAWWVWYDPSCLRRHNPHIGKDRPKLSIWIKRQGDRYWYEVPPRRLEL